MSNIYDEYDQANTLAFVNILEHVEQRRVEISKPSAECERGCCCDCCGCCGCGCCCCCW